jgi:hypothetical protein
MAFAVKGPVFFGHDKGVWTGCLRQDDHLP